MKKILIIWIVIMLSCSIVSSEDCPDKPPCPGGCRVDEQPVIKETTRAYLVKYPDGMTEKFLTVYQGCYLAQVWQTGSASKPLEGKFVDDRTCHWRVGSVIQRKGFLVSHSGVRAEYAPWQRVFYTTTSHKQGPDWHEIFYHRICEEAEGDWRRNIEAEKSSIINEFDKIVADDQKKNVEEIRNMLKAVEVNQTN